MEIWNLKEFLAIQSTGTNSIAYFKERGFDIGIYLTSERNLEEKVQNTIGDASAERVLKVHLITLQHLIEVLGAPTHDHPNKMILDHRYHCVRNASLLGRQACIQVFAEFLAQLANNDRAVRDLLAIQFDERQRALLGAEFQFMVHIL